MSAQFLLLAFITVVSAELKFNQFLPVILQQLSNDGERNNARKVTLRHDRQANYTRQDTSASNGSNMRRHGSAGDARTSDNRNNNREDIGVGAFDCPDKFVWFHNQGGKIET